MAVRRALIPVDPTGTVHIQELDDTAMNSIHTQYAEYVWSQYPITTLSVVSSGGNLTGLPMTDTRYQAGSSTTRVDRFATAAETPNISIVTVNYATINQTIATGATPVDTNNLRYPLYLHNTGSGNDIDTHFRAMSSQDFYDTFVLPAINVINNSPNALGDYYISTSPTPAVGSRLVSPTPVFTDTRANVTAYTSAGIPEAQDQPTTITNYYLHVYGSDVADDNDLPLYLDANDEQIKQYTLEQWAQTLGPWLQNYYISQNIDTTYSINGPGLTQGSAMVNTILSPTGTGYTTRYVNTNDYRTQEFPNGTPITANVYELKKYVDYPVANGDIAVTLTFTLVSGGDIPTSGLSTAFLNFTLESEGQVLVQGAVSANTTYSLSSEGDVLIQGIGDVDTSYSLVSEASDTSEIQGTSSASISYSLASEGDILIQGIGDGDISYSLASDAHLQLEQLATIDNPNAYSTSASDNFGYSTAVYGDYAIVGASNEDDAGGSASGKAYIFNSANGQLLHTLDNPNAYGGSANDNFGRDVDIDGNYAIIGAPGESDAGGLSSGKAYIFYVANGTLLHTLDNPNAYDTSLADSFGNSVAISGTKAIVGAVNEDDAGGTTSGKAYIFDVITGNLQVTLDNPNAYGTSASDSFSSGINAVDINGDYAMVGAYAEDDAGGTTSGKAYIFNSANGQLLHTLDNPNTRSTSADDFFGSSVAINDNFAVVSAINERGADNAGGGGVVYVFDTANGSLLYTFDNPNIDSTSFANYFGVGLSLSGNYVAIGSRESVDNGADTFSGVVYIYDLTSGTLEYTVKNPNAYDTPAGDQFGDNVSIFGNKMIVGASAEDDAGGTQSGKAYIFKIPTLEATVNVTLDFSTTGAMEKYTYTEVETGLTPDSFEYFGAAVSISNEFYSASAYGIEDTSTGNPESGLIFVYSTFDNSLIYTIGNPNVYGTTANDKFGKSLSMNDEYLVAGSDAEDSSAGINVGVAYVFNTSNGALLHTLREPTETQNSDYGNCVAIQKGSGKRMAVSAQLTTNIGQVYVYSADTGNLIQTIPAPDQTNDFIFGNQIELDGDYMIVGSFSSDVAAFDGAGRMYVYEWNSGTSQYDLLYTINNPNVYNTGFSDNFGSRVAIDQQYGYFAALALDEDTASFSGYGALYIFDLATGNLLHSIQNTLSPSGGYDAAYEQLTMSTGKVYVGSRSSLRSKIIIYDCDTGQRLGDIPQPSLEPPNIDFAASSLGNKPLASYRNRFIAGAPWFDDGAADQTGRVYVYEMPIQVTLESSIEDPNAYGTRSYDEFGHRVSISGNYAIASARGEGDAGGIDSGKAYIFNSANGQLLHTLDNPNAYGTSDDDVFGGSASISGDYAIVGAPGEDDAGGSISGKAYIFHVANGALAHTLDNPTAYGTSDGDRFGWSSDIDGDYAIVGAYSEDDAGGTSSGKAYIYHVANGALAHTLDNPNAYNTSASDNFGWSVAISGNYAIVGAYLEDDHLTTGSASGKAYIFNVTTGALVHTLDNPNAYSTSAGDNFGYKVAIDGNYAIVGAYGEDDAGGTTSGKAYIFNVTTGSLVRTLDNPNAYSTSVGDSFGFSVAIDGNYAVLGAYGEDDAGGSQSGKVYLFDITNGDLLATIDNPSTNGTAGDRFGESVSISGNKIIIGAPDEDYTGAILSSGKVYIYKIT